MVWPTASADHQRPRRRRLPCRPATTAKASALTNGSNADPTPYPRASSGLEQVGHAALAPSSPTTRYADQTLTAITASATTIATAYARARAPPRPRRCWPPWPRATS